MGKSPKSRYRIPILLSVVFHAALIIALMLWYRPSLGLLASEEPTKDDRSTDLAKPVSPAPKAPLPSTVDIKAPPEQIRSSIQSRIEQVETIPDQQKLKELDKELNRLDRVSNQESVDQITTAVAQSMGIDTSQYADKLVPTDGDFDHKTAQIKTVSRQRDDAGKWQYEAIMVDAQGRQMKTPMDESAGASAYETFEKLKQYPMAESLYQQLIMPMLQKMIENEATQ